VLNVNQRACEIYGIHQSDFIGLSVETISSNISHDRALIKKALEKGQLLNSEIAHSHKSGTELLLQTDISVISYQGKQAMLTINRDRMKKRRC
jgi:PAS domain S-box-containing protein